MSQARCPLLLNPSVCPTGTGTYLTENSDQNQEINPTKYCFLMYRLIRVSLVVPVTYIRAKENPGSLLFSAVTSL